MCNLSGTVAAFVTIIAVFACAAEARNTASQSNLDAARAIQAVLDTPDNELDFARAKLTLDKLVDPSIDVDRGIREIDIMVAAVKALAGPKTDTMQKLTAVRRFIYIDGTWNGHRPFAYDLSDPLGKNLKNKLLTTYLETRRGNCVSMPVLYLILADRLGLHVTLSTAPMHLFVKFTDDQGKTHNLETTSGALPARDEWYRQNYAMTDLAIQNGVYLKALNRKEAVAVMAEVVLEHLMAKKRYKEVIAVSGIVLKHYPSFVPVLLMRGEAYAGLIDTEFRTKYPRPQDIPPESRETYLQYDAENQRAFAQAEALGWRDADGGKSTSPVQGH